MGIGGKHTGYYLKKYNLLDKTHHPAFLEEFSLDFTERLNMLGDERRHISVSRLIEETKNKLYSILNKVPYQTEWVRIKGVANIGDMVRLKKDVTFNDIHHIPKGSVGEIIAIPAIRSGVYITTDDGNLWLHSSIVKFDGAEAVLLKEHTTKRSKYVAGTRFPINYTSNAVCVEFDGVKTALWCSVKYLEISRDLGDVLWRKFYHKTVKDLVL